METIFMNMRNSKTNEPHKFVLNLSQRLVEKAQVNMLLCLFVSREKIQDNDKKQGRKRNSSNVE